MKTQLDGIHHRQLIYMCISCLWYSPLRLCRHCRYNLVHLVHQHREPDEPEAVGATADDRVADLADEADVILSSAAATGGLSASAAKADDTNRIR